MEVRGFSREGQTTCESLTCYNAKAVSISFLLQGNEKKPNQAQMKTLCLFIEQSIESNELDENYLIFQHSQLISSYFDDHESVEELRTEMCQLNLGKSNAIYENVFISLNLFFILFKLQKL